MYYIYYKIISNFDKYTRKTFFVQEQRSSAYFTLKSIFSINVLVVVFLLIYCFTNDPTGFFYLQLGTPAKFAILVASFFTALASLLLVLNYVALALEFRTDLNHDQATNVHIGSILERNRGVFKRGSKMTRRHYAYIFNMLTLMVIFYLDLSALFFIWSRNPVGFESCITISNQQAGLWVIYFLNLFPGFNYCEDKLPLLYAIIRYIVNVSVIGFLLQQMSLLISNVSSPDDTSKKP